MHALLSKIVINHRKKNWESCKLTRIIYELFFLLNFVVLLVIYFLLYFAFKWLISESSEKRITMEWASSLMVRMVTSTGKHYG